MGLCEWDPHSPQSLQQPCAVSTDLYLTRPPGAWQPCASTSCWVPWSRHLWLPWPQGPTHPHSLSGRLDYVGDAWRWMFSHSMVRSASLRQRCQPCPPLFQASSCPVALSPCPVRCGDSSH